MNSSHSIQNRQLGISLTSPGNTPLAPGSQELITILFDVIGTDPDVALVTFGGPTQFVTTTGSVQIPTAQDGESGVRLLCTTSTNVRVSGRVTSPDGVGLRNASVSITDQNGNRRTVTTSSLGYYTIDDVKAGDTYVINATSRRYRFGSRVVQVSDSLADLDFIGME